MNPSSSLDCHETPERSAPSSNPSHPTETGQMSRIGAPRLRKPQSKSRLDSLPAELLAQLEVWLVDQNRSYDEVCGRLAKEHGVTTTRSSLSRYYRRQLAPRRQAQALFDARMRKLIAANGGEEATLARAASRPRGADGTAAGPADGAPVAGNGDGTRTDAAGAGARGPGQRAVNPTTTRGTSRQVPPTIPADQRELQLVAEDRGAKKKKKYFGE